MLLCAESFNNFVGFILFVISILILLIIAIKWIVWWNFEILKFWISIKNNKLACGRRRILANLSKFGSTMICSLNPLLDITKFIHFLQNVRFWRFYILWPLFLYEKSTQNNFKTQNLKVHCKVSKWPNNSKIYQHSHKTVEKNEQTIKLYKKKKLRDA